MDSDAKRLRLLATQSALTSMEVTRDMLNDLREMVGILLGRKKPIYDRRREAVMRGDTATCAECTRELKAISLEIEQLNASAHELARADSDTVREMLRPGEEVPK